MGGLNQPFDFPRSKAPGLLSLPAGRQGLILSGGAFDPTLGGWRRQSIKLISAKIRENLSENTQFTLFFFGGNSCNFIL